MLKPTFRSAEQCVLLVLVGFSKAHTLLKREIDHSQPPNASMGCSVQNVME